jgi:hypothetical protein
MDTLVGKIRARYLSLFSNHMESNASKDMYLCDLICSSKTGHFIKRHFVVQS